MWTRWSRNGRQTNHEHPALWHRPARWNYPDVLQDDGISYDDYVEQRTHLLYLKMDHASLTMVGKKSANLMDLNRSSLLSKDGVELEAHSWKILKDLGRVRGQAHSRAGPAG